MREGSCAASQNSVQQLWSPSIKAVRIVRTARCMARMDAEPHERWLPHDSEREQARGRAGGSAGGSSREDLVAVSSLATMSVGALELQASSKRAAAAPSFEPRRRGELHSTRRLLPHTFEDGWSFTVFCVVSISTCGFGDMSPSSPFTKAFNTFYVLRSGAAPNLLWRRAVQRITL